MTPVELRQAFNELIGAYRRSWPNTYTRTAMALHLLAGLAAHPWLIDQIPWDVLDMAQEDAR